MARVADLYPIGSAARAIADALKMDLPDKVTITQFAYVDYGATLSRKWKIKFIVPGMDHAALIEVERPYGEEFPYEEVLTKIRLFL